MHLSTMISHIAVRMLVVIVFLAVSQPYTLLAQHTRATKLHTTNCTLLYKEEHKESAYPRLSSDKKSILFQTNRNGKWQLCLLDRASTKQTLLTPESSNNNFPDWSADNAWIAFVSDRDGNEELYMMRTDGSNLKRITNHPGRDIHPYFSPDGQYILFNSTRGNESLDIYRYTIANGAVERLTNTMDNETCARYAPDMKSIVYLRNNNSSDDIYLLHLENFLSDNVTNTPRSRDGWAMFSPNGKWIYYSSMESGIYCLYRIHPDGSSQQQLTVAKPGEEDARVCVSSDGNFMLYNKRIGDSIEIWGCDILP